jgi:hypothetical protein
MLVLMLLEASGFSQANSVKVEQCGSVRCAIWLGKKTVCLPLHTVCKCVRTFANAVSARKEVLDAVQVL